MMEKSIQAWISELRRFNSRLHLMGPAMLAGIEDEIEVLLPLLMHIEEPEIADLGSGSGLPSIPYKILHPQSRLYLIERSEKKCTFLGHVVGSLGLVGVTVVAQDPLHADVGPFDAVLARSFSPLTTLKEVCVKILKENGRLYYIYTGATPDLAPDFEAAWILTQKNARNTLHLGKFNLIP